MELSPESAAPDSRKRWFAIVRNVLLAVIALVVGLSWMSNSFNVWQEKQMNLSLAAEMLAAPTSARIAIDKHVSRTGSLSGSGKGVAGPTSKTDYRRNFVWTISDEGRILGRNTVGDRIVVEWTPSMQGTGVSWACKVTFPERYATLSQPPCPAIQN